MNRTFKVAFATIVGALSLSGAVMGGVALGRKSGNGESAYEIAVRNGFSGTEAEWLSSLKGSNGGAGQNGKSAYEIAVESGYTGTEDDFVNELFTKGMSYGAMRNIAVNAINDYNLNPLTSEFMNPDEDIQNVIDEFEPFTIKIESGVWVDNLDGLGKIPQVTNEATLSFKFNDDNDIIAHMLFINTDSAGVQHVDDSYLTVIKDSSQVKHYYVTYDCAFVEENVKNPQSADYQEMDEDHYKLLSTTLVAGSRYISELSTVGDIFGPSDLLGFLIGMDFDGSTTTSMLISGVLSDCKVENDVYKFASELPASDQIVYRNLDFTLTDDGRINHVIVSKDVDFYTDVETTNITYNVVDFEAFDELVSIPDEFDSYYNSGDPDFNPIILDSVTDGDYDSLFTIMGCIQGNITDALSPRAN